MGGRLVLCVGALALIAAGARAQTEVPRFQSAQPQPSQAEASRFYFSATDGLLSDNTSFRPDGMSAGTVPQTPRSHASGYDFGGFRTEVEHHRSFGVSDPVTGSHIEDNSVMFNSLYDIPTGPKLKTFIGAGFGAVNRSQQIPGATNSEWDSAYQVRGGLTYDISKALSGLLEFRQTGILAGSTPKVSFKNRGVMLGLKYKID
jgi:opacity protein-like surface antigen